MPNMAVAHVQVYRTEELTFLSTLSVLLLASSMEWHSKWNKQEEQ